MKEDALTESCPRAPPLHHCPAALLQQTREAGSLTGVHHFHTRRGSAVFSVMESYTMYVNVPELLLERMDTTLHAAVYIPPSSHGSVDHFSALSLAEKPSREIWASTHVKRRLTEYYASGSPDLGVRVSLHRCK